MAAHDLKWKDVNQWDPLELGFAKNQFVKFAGADPRLGYIHYRIAPVSSATGRTIAICTLGMYNPGRYYYHLVCGDYATYQAVCAVIGDLTPATALGHVGDLGLDNYRLFLARNFKRFLQRVKSQSGLQLEADDITIDRGSARHVVVALRRRDAPFANDRVLSSVTFNCGRLDEEMTWVNWLGIIGGQLPI